MDITELKQMNLVIGVVFSLFIIFGVVMLSVNGVSVPTANIFDWIIYFTCGGAGVCGYVIALHFFGR